MKPSREPTFPEKRVMDGATQPKMIRGTMKKIIWLVRCFTIMVICRATSVAGPLRCIIAPPRSEPMMIATISLTAVLSNIFFM